MVYNSVNRKRRLGDERCSSPNDIKSIVSQKEVLWDYNGIAYLDLEPENQTINTYTLNNSPNRAMQFKNIVFVGIKLVSLFYLLVEK